MLAWGLTKTKAEFLRAQESVVAAAVFLNRTVWGRYLLALGRNEQAARYSTVRFRAPGEVLVAVADDRGVHIDRYEVR